ncbi:hypothetical protein FIBSPDRAFT_1054421 [Athelia psychrophila]|uniref:Peptidase A1 domain-containing protein n=1 Tax=Athelia psychrophila TaxID=1759441 RepID=A0A167VC10_9AGAM|nr:hypothetical protein FIBSPDRAFT_1054421 [Fibularhizoctonia sp. CBS 109695]
MSSNALSSKSKPPSVQAWGNCDPLNHLVRAGLVNALASLAPAQLSDGDGSATIQTSVKLLPPEIDLPRPFVHARRSPALALLHDLYHQIRLKGRLPSLISTRSKLSAPGGTAPVNITRGAMTVLNRAAPSYSGSVLVIYITLPTSGNTYIFPGSTAEKLGLTGAGKQAILDTGTTLNHVPTKLAKTYNAQYRFVEDEDTHYIACNATVPKFEVVIGRKTFTVDAKNQILPSGTNEKGEAVCISGTQDDGDPRLPTSSRTRTRSPSGRHVKFLALIWTIRTLPAHYNFELIASVWNSL